MLHSGSCTSAPTLSGTRLSAGDAGYNDLDSTTVSSAARCCAACGANSQCAAWTYNKSPGTSPNCWLIAANQYVTFSDTRFTSSAPRSTTAGTCNGKPVKTNTRLSAADAGATDLDSTRVTSAQDCCSACSNNSQCAGWTYRVNPEAYPNCWLVRAGGYAVMPGDSRFVSYQS
ncbi:hypothetical protein N2152v2_001474 [Parachlorella kessleri]